MMYCNSSIIDQKVSVTVMHIRKHEKLKLTVKELLDLYLYKIRAILAHLFKTSRSC